MRSCAVIVVAAATTCWIPAADAAGRAAPRPLGSAPPVGWAIPFALMLLAIAILPLALPRWWQDNRHKLWVSLALGAPVLVLYARRSPHRLLETGIEFTSFMLLLASLCVISGGVYLAGDLPATPQINAGFLAAGTVLASLIGTTGASLLLIRPLLRTNRQRLHKAHTVVFFIFLVCNIGGALTPLGDPPLFMGYLEGVPFTWSFRLVPEWLTASAVILLVYFIWDSVMFTREPIAALTLEKLREEPLRVAGTPNLALLAAIVLSVAFLRAPAREAVMLAATALSLGITPGQIRRANEFTSYAIAEVAALFFGIFLTMLPALDILRARGAALGIREPWQFFWATGGLSSFLDNTPTYLVFLNLARGLPLVDEVAGVTHPVLRAISLGAVFMGANTYIGNAPNFMVKSLAEERGIRMPSFFGYMVYSAGILLPLFLGITLLFLV